MSGKRSTHKREKTYTPQEAMDIIIGKSTLEEEEHFSDDSNASQLPTSCKHKERTKRHAEGDDEEPGNTAKWMAESSTLDLYQILFCRFISTKGSWRWLGLLYC